MERLGDRTVRDNFVEHIAMRRMGAPQDIADAVHVPGFGPRLLDHGADPSRHRRSPLN